MAILEITLVVDGDNRPAAAAVHNKNREPFLTSVKGATSRQLFTADVVGDFSPLLASDPDIRVYEEA
jgi:hypothetical protein